MGTVTVEAILTTSQPIKSVYGPIQLSLEVLGQLAEAVRDGTIPLRWEHDLRRPLKAVALDAGVRPRSDGYEEAWAMLEVDEDCWTDWQHGLAELGAPGGMSFTFTTPLGVFETESETSLPLAVAADASHFPDEVIIAAAQGFAGLGPTTAERLYQFSHEVEARVVLEYGVALLQSVGPGVVSNYIFDVLKPILQFRRKHSPDQNTAFEFLVRGEGAFRQVEARLDTDSEEVAKMAVEALVEIAGQVGTYTFSADGQWVRTGELSSGATGHSPESPEHHD